VYVNDFDFNTGVSRLIQAEGKFRNTAKDIGEYYVRSDTGKMIPLEQSGGAGETARRK